MGCIGCGSAAVSEWRYLYRASDRSGALVDVMFSEHRDVPPRKHSSSRRRWSPV
jgi:hypothetical protein